MRLLPCTLISLILLTACGGNTGDTIGTDTNQTGTATATATAVTTDGTSSSSTLEPTGTTAGTGVTDTATGTTGVTSTGGTTAETTAGTTGTTGTTAETATTTDTGTTTGGTTDDTGVVPGGGACVEDSDCVLHNDCCDCFAVAKADDPPICKKGCEQTQCDLQGIDEVKCRFGVCVTEKVACDPIKVACDSLPPNCPKGQVASVEGGCWSGECVAASSCDVVPDCDLCPSGFMCVFLEALAPQSGGTCEPIPPECDGKIDCGCAGQHACVDPFTGCNKGGDNELHCSCPNC